MFLFFITAYNIYFCVSHSYTVNEANIPDSL